MNQVSFLLLTAGLLCVGCGGSGGIKSSAADGAVSAQSIVGTYSLTISQGAPQTGLWNSSGTVNIAAATTGSEDTITGQVELDTGQTIQVSGTINSITSGGQNSFVVSITAPSGLTTTATESGTLVENAPNSWSGNLAHTSDTGHDTALLVKTSG